MPRKGIISLFIEAPRRGPGGRAPILKTATDMYQKALETEHFFSQGLHKGNLKVFSKGGIGQ
jgi:hypothetical protein